jgi:PhnB protein
MSVQKIPEGFNTITPTLIIDGAAQAIELYTKAFGAKELYRIPCPNSGKVMHACVQLGSSKLFLSDVMPEMGSAATTSSFYIYMEDVDAVFRQATKVGLQEVAAVKDMFWGDRVGCVKDRFGNRWTIATHVRDVSKEEMEEAKKKMAAKAA